MTSYGQVTFSSIYHVKVNYQRSLDIKVTHHLDLKEYQRKLI